VVEHRAVRHPRARVLGGAGVVLGAHSLVAGEFEMPGCRTEKVVRAQPRLRRQPTRQLAVQLAPRSPEHRLVRDLVQDLCLNAYSRSSSLLEPARGSASSRRTSAGKVSCARRVELDQRLVPEHRPDDARLLQRQPLGRRQAVEPGLQDADERRRHLGEHQPLGVDGPDVAGLDRPLVDQHLDQLFHVERDCLPRRR
jgi:hypothetical protein